MYIKPIEQQITNRTGSKPKRLRKEGDNSFGEELESLLDIVSIEHVNPDEQKRDQEQKKPPKRQKPAEGEDKSLDIVC